MAEIPDNFMLTVEENPLLAELDCDPTLEVISEYPSESCDINAGNCEDIVAFMGCNLNSEKCKHTTNAYVHRCGQTEADSTSYEDWGFTFARV